MSLTRWAQSALLLALIAVPLSLRGLQATAYGGWPSLGFAIALFVFAGRERRGLVLGAETVVVTLAVSHSYQVELWQGALGSLAVTLPSLLVAHLLVRRRSGQLRLDDVDLARYHLVVTGGALLSGAVATVAAITEYDLVQSLLAGLMSALAALTAQLAVLPLFVRTAGRRAAGGSFELAVQRTVMVVVTVAVFYPTTRLDSAFLVLVALAWAATRATRREAHVQLFVVCLVAYALTFEGRGPLAGALEGLPEALAPGLLYLFVAAACLLTVALTTMVEKLFSITTQATRAAGTMERLLDSVSGAMIIATDARGRITHFNTGAQQTMGYEPTEVLGHSPEMFHPPEEVARQAEYFGVPADHTAVVMEMVRRGESRDWEIVRGNGERRMVSLTCSPVIGPDGEVIGFIGAGEDITDRLRSQEALRTALERERASVLRLEEVDHVKQELVSNVSHELRTPITSIAGYAELLRDGSLGELNRLQLDAVHRIDRNSGRLGLIVEDLLTLSRAESGSLDLAHEELDLRLVAGGAFELLEELLRVNELESRLVLPEEPVRVVGDFHALERAVVNLMGNAIKFTPAGGRAMLTVRVEESWAYLEVEDTGMGIPEEDLKHLFRRFFRSSVATHHAIQGTGLGLSIVHSIITQHDGTVSVSSSRGVGTTMTVRLPRV